MKKYLLGLMLLLPFSVYAECDCEEDEDEPVIYRPHDYMGLKYGGAAFQSAGAASSAASIGLMYGYHYSSLFAIEAEYTEIDRYVDAISSGKATTTSLSAIHSVSVNKGLALFGKVGYAITTVSNSPALGGSLSDITYGFGLTVGISESWKLRLSNDFYSVNMPAKTMLINSNLGLIYHF